jgi:hypothetical protein
MLTFGHLIVVIVVCVAAAPAHAQTPSNARRSFVDVPFGPVWDDTYSDSARARRHVGIRLAFGLDWGGRASKSTWVCPSGM